jgi:hypothetical protein
MLSEIDFVKTAARISGLYKSSTLDTLRANAAEAESPLKDLAAYKEQAMQLVASACGRATLTDLITRAAPYGAKRGTGREHLTSLITKKEWGLRVVAPPEPVSGVTLAGAPYQPEARTVEGWYALAEHHEKLLRSQIGSLNAWPDQLRAKLREQEAAAVDTFHEVFPTLSPEDALDALKRAVARGAESGADVASEWFSTFRETHSSDVAEAVTLFAGMVRGSGEDTLRAQELRVLIVEALRPIDAGEPLERAAHEALRLALKRLVGPRREQPQTPMGSLESQSRREAAHALLETGVAAGAAAVAVALLPGSPGSAAAAAAGARTPTLHATTPAPSPSTPPVTGPATLVAPTGPSTAPATPAAAGGCIPVSFKLPGDQPDCQPLTQICAVGAPYYVSDLDQLCGPAPVAQVSVAGTDTVKTGACLVLTSGGWATGMASYNAAGSPASACTANIMQTSADIGGQPLKVCQESFPHTRMTFLAVLTTTAGSTTACMLEDVGA